MDKNSLTHTGWSCGLIGILIRFLVFQRFYDERYYMYDTI